VVAQGTVMDTPKTARRRPSISEVIARVVKQDRKALDLLAAYDRDEAPELDQRVASG
jgi:hypothetical protein